MLFNQGYGAPRLKSSLQKFYGRHYYLVDRYEISISHMTMDLLLSYITAKPFIRLDSIYEQHTGCIIRNRNCLPLTNTYVHPLFLVGSVFLIFFSFLSCPFLFYLAPSCVLCTNVASDSGLSIRFFQRLFDYIQKTQETIYYRVQFSNDKLNYLCICYVLQFPYHHNSDPFHNYTHRYML